MAEWRAHLRAQAVEDEGQVWPEHWHAVSLFVAMGTQWRCAAGLGGLMWLGLDYAPLRQVNATVRRAMPRTLRQPWRAVFEQVRQLEAAAMAARNGG